MNELIRRLRYVAELECDDYGLNPEDHASWEAADTIEVQQSEIDNLKQQLIESQMDARVGKQFGDLWYFAMDEAALEFERIVTNYSPACWMTMISEVKRSRDA